jgi:hypothetical protein
VQVDPADPRYCQQTVTQQRAIGHHRAAVGCQIGQCRDEFVAVWALGPQHRDALFESEFGDG